MLVIGIDPGTAITGYGLVRESEDGSLSLVDYGAIVTASDQAMNLRLLELYHHLKDLLLLHQPDCGAVEKLFFARNVRTALTVDRRGGSIAFLAEMNLPLENIPR
jgi:crossover junction endodeoxyribonuclease RuvC